LRGLESFRSTWGHACNLQKDLAARPSYPPPVRWRGKPSSRSSPGPPSRSCTRTLSSWASAYVLAVLIVAARWGLTESLVTSVAAMLCPELFFSAADPVTHHRGPPELGRPLRLFRHISHPPANCRRASGIARPKLRPAEVEVDQLYQLSLSLMLLDTTRELGPQLAAAIKKHFGFDTIAFCDAATGVIHFAGTEDPRFEGGVAGCGYNRLFMVCFAEAIGADDPGSCRGANSTGWTYPGEPGSDRTAAL